MKKNLTAEERKQRAKKASKARWDKFHVNKEAALAPVVPPPPISEPVKIKPTPTTKVFGSALAAAEKRLEKAILERAEAMNIVAARNAEIPSLTQVIKALGGTINPQPVQEVQGIGGMTMEAMLEPAVAPTFPAVPLARGGGLGIIPENNSNDENQFLKGDEFTGGGGWV